jgi:hypothetical protein
MVRRRKFSILLTVYTQTGAFMATNKPRPLKVYIVTTPTGERLVRAKSGASAIAHVVTMTHTVRIAWASDVYTLAAAGVKLEEVVAAELLDKRRMNHAFEQS